MPLITVPVADLMKNELMKEGWYKATVVGWEIGPSKDKASVNYVALCELDSNKKQMPARFNSKQLQFIEPFIAAVTEKPVDRSKPLNFNTDELTGKRVHVKITNSTYEGRLTDQVSEYLPISADISSPF